MNGSLAGINLPVTPSSTNEDMPPTLVHIIGNPNIWASQILLGLFSM